MRKNFPGWHVTATDDGYGSILRLIKLLETSPFGSKRTFELVAPDAWSASSELKKVAEQKVVISLVEPDSHWSLESIDGKLHVKLGLSSLSSLHNGILDARKGKYDFSIGVNQRPELVVLVRSSKESKKLQGQAWPLTLLLIQGFTPIVDYRY